MFRVMHATSQLRRLRTKASTTKARAPLVWLRHRGLDRNDVFLAEFPRSGSTWLRFMLFEVFTGTPAGFLNVNRIIPEIGTHGAASPILPTGGRLIKTHERFRHEYNRAIYLARDIRDVVLSAFACDEEMGFPPYSVNCNFDAYLQAYLSGSSSRFGSWRDHVLSWLDSHIARNGNLLVVRYEDMRRNPEEIIGRVLNFLGAPVDSDIVRNAVANNSLKNMRAKEDLCKRPGIKLGRGTLLRRHRSSRENGRFVRRGLVGGWRETLTSSQLQLIDRCAGDVLVRMGYTLDQHTIKP